MIFESSPRFEQKNGMEKIHRFFNIDTKTEQKLKESIEKSKGLIRIFVHPDFEAYTQIDSVKKGEMGSIEGLKQAERVFKKILSSESEQAPPVFIFEAGWHEDDFLEKEEAIAKVSARDVYVIRTEGANPNPLPPDFERGLRFMEYYKVSDAEREEMWKWIIEELKRWKVKKILIGGLEFYVSDKSDIGHGGCLGSAIEKLKDHFDIEISNMTWPERIRKL